MKQRHYTSSNQKQGHKHFMREVQLERLIIETERRDIETERFGLAQKNNNKQDRITKNVLVCILLANLGIILLSIAL